MKMNKLFGLCIVLVLMSLVSACSTPSTKDGGEGRSETFVIKAGHAAAKEHFAQRSFENFKELVESRSNGRVKVEIYPAGELGGEREMLEQVLLGELTMIAPASAPLDAATKYMAVWDLPYLFNDRETAHKVLDGEVGQTVLDSLSDKGLVGLVYWENGFRHLTNNVKPITNVQDLSGIKMRTLENPMQIKAWSLLETNTTPIAFTELYGALETKIVDAQETPLSLMYSSKFHEVQKYLTLTGHTYSPWPVVLNKEFYDRLPEDLQKVVKDAALETRAYNRELSKQDEETSLELLKQEGMEVTELTSEQKQEFKMKMSEIYEDIEAEVGSEFFNQLMNEVGM